jgi:glutamate mutase epsilon subunit
MNLTNEQKAAIYDEGIRRYNLVEEQIRQIRAKNFEVSDSDRMIIERLERKKKEIFNRTQTLHAK